MQTCLREPAVCITICFINAITRTRVSLPYRQFAKKQNCQEVRSREQSVIWRGQDLSTKSKGIDQTAATAVIYISWANKLHKFQKRNRSVRFVNLPSVHHEPTRRLNLNRGYCKRNIINITINYGQAKG